MLSPARRLYVCISPSMMDTGVELRKGSGVELGKGFVFRLSSEASLC